jgi:hypothetical protein
MDVLHGITRVPDVTADRRIRLDCESSCTLDFDEELECWQNWLHEVTTLSCNMMTTSLCFVSSEVRYFPTYDGLNDVDVFLDEFEREVPEKQLLRGFRLGTARYAQKMVGCAQR